MTDALDPALLQALPAPLQPWAALVLRAGAEVMAVYARPFAVHGKADASPVTEADWRAEAVILQGLAAQSPNDVVVAEEAMAAGGALPAADRLAAGPFWLVDPLDGTREFIGRNGEFTVNLARIEQGEPVLGVVLAPAQGPRGRLYVGARGLGAWQVDEAGVRRIACRRPPAEGLTVVASRSHGDPTAVQAFLAGRPVARQVAAGSSLKLCLLAAGEADLYPRFGRTMEWDIAAGHAVLAAAGGRVDTLDGAPLRYGKPGFENPDFVAWGLPA